ncbi:MULTISPECIES: S8 family serine peptidase [unclassified Iodidimonas]|jgi:subtilisin family serine protease|uniref:S8 family serine peptidase n=1 Tax=unclassified Iodidimonas TaxID=2626145 RepID=UPI0024829B8B|nr:MULTISPECIES: S8 family serine peptidase [unclassified Iodidimonas]
MIRTKTIATLLAAALTTSAAMAQQEQKAPQFGIPVALQEKVKDNYIFVFKDEVPANRVEGLARSMAARAGVKVGYIYKHSIKGFSAQMPASMAERMSADPSVDYYDHDGVAFVSAQIEGVSSDQVESRMQSTPWGITRVGGPADGTNLGKYAFVIDTGIDLDHPDLNVATSLSRSFVPGSSSADDQNGHGTHVAGTIAAINNGFGVVGVAAGARVVSVRVLNAQGSGAFSDIIAGVDYVAQVGLAGEVANLSLGGPRNAPLDNAVRNAAARGIFFVLAAGNESQNANNVSPARANGTNIYTISAHDSQDRFASFSNFGNPPVDCADPGVSILSTWLNGGFNTISGTSMAAPHAAGIFLINNGQAFNGGLVTGDPDGNPDPICVL